jgi:elongation factor Ts
MADIKKALLDANDDYDLAKEALSHLIKPQDTSNRVASKGMCQVRTHEDQAILLEITGETDFVIKNPYFLDLFNDIYHLLFTNDIMSLEELNTYIFNGETIENHLKKSATKIGENISIRRFNRLYKTELQAFGSYQHQDGKNVSLVILNKQDSELQKYLPMQIIAYDAKYISHHYLSVDDMEKLKESFEKYPDNSANLEAYILAKSLYDQPFMRDETQTIKSLLSSRDIKIVKMLRYTLGEGIKDKLECRLDIPLDAAKIKVTPIY